MLVDEDGELLQSSAPTSPALSDRRFDRRSDRRQSPSSLPSTPVQSRSTSPTTRPADGSSPSTPVQSRITSPTARPAETGPQDWESCKLVLYTADGGSPKEVIFLRMGSEADWINNGRCRIEWRTIKPGKKRVFNTHSKWVMPETLTLPAQEQPAADTGAANPSPTRKSPRNAQHLRPEGADLPPERAVHERERKLPTRKDAPVRGRQKAERQTAETKVSIEKRITDHPGHSLCKNDLNGMLRCAGCAVDIPNKLSSINAHIKMEVRAGVPTGHAKKLKAWLQRARGDAALKQSLVDYFADHPHEDCQVKDADELLYRYRVAEAFVACPPFERADRFRSLLCRSGYALTSATHLKVFIPKIEQAELDLLVSELTDQYIGIAFDGTTRLGEAINVTARYCSADFEIVMRLMDFTTLK